MVQKRDMERHYLVKDSRCFRTCQSKALVYAGQCPAKDAIFFREPKKADHRNCQRTWREWTLVSWCIPKDKLCRMWCLCCTKGVPCMWCKTYL